MVKLSVLSWNIRGLQNSKIKSVKCLDYLNRKGADVAFIQETHLSSADAMRFRIKYTRLQPHPKEVPSPKGQ